MHAALRNAINRRKRHPPLPAAKMESDDLVPGSVVRFSETTSRWFIGVVRKNVGTNVELEFLGGGRTTAPIEKVESFLAYLQSRETVLSLTRENLCYAFYGEALTRLRQERADKMKRFLRSHGIRFNPDNWAANERIQIWPDDSHVKGGSPNFTSAALLSRPPEGNSEIAVVTRLPAKRNGSAKTCSVLGLDQLFGKVIDWGTLTHVPPVREPLQANDAFRVTDATLRVSERKLEILWQGNAPGAVSARALIEVSGAWVVICSDALVEGKGLVLDVPQFLETDQHKLLSLKSSQVPTKWGSARPTRRWQSWRYCASAPAPRERASIAF